MRRFIILSVLFFIVLLMGSCKKDAVNDYPTSIIGTWELRETSAAMNPSINYYPPGNGNSLTFTSNNKYEKYVNGQLTKTGEFTIIKDATVQDNICLIFPDGQYTNRLVYDNDYNAPKLFLQISDNKLSFVSGCYAVDGGHNEIYERTK